MASQNGHNGSKIADRGALTRAQVEATLEQEARAILGVSREEVYAMLDRGELEGTPAEAEFSTLRSLAAD
jgi:hypothetical protein